MKKLFVIINSCLCFALFALTALQTIAHPMAQSKVGIYIKTKNLWEFKLQLPEDRLLTAVSLSRTTSHTDSLPTLSSDDANNYISQKILLSSQSDFSQKWPMKITKLVPPIGNDTLWQVSITFTPPANVDQTKVYLKYDIIVEDIYTHRTNIWLVENQTKKMPIDKPIYLGYIRDNRRTLVIENNFAD